ncbi:hypothetical protein ONZ45_g4165 [Pleurotus djamor]|nr:hypothetical protein ONZ45_g4165 [Pleurotus djamor]
MRRPSFAKLKPSIQQQRYSPWLRKVRRQSYGCIHLLARFDREYTGNATKPKKLTLIYNMFGLFGRKAVQGMLFGRERKGAIKKATKMFKEIAGSGVNVMAAGSTIGDLTSRFSLPPSLQHRRINPLWAKHEEKGVETWGVDIEADTNGTLLATEHEVLHLLTSKLGLSN